MKRLIVSIGVCLVSVTAGCDLQEIIANEFGNKGIRLSGTVRTAQGVPVEGVEVKFGFLDQPVMTNSKGYYRTGEEWIEETKCHEVRWRFSKDPHTRIVLVGKCGERKVNISDWPPEG